MTVSDHIDLYPKNSGDNTSWNINHVDDHRFAYELIERFFDRQYYIRHTPALIFTGIDPIEHYLEIGWKEGRNPNDTFSTSFYLSTNPDVANDGINPFVHYIGWGKSEGRLGTPGASPDMDHGQILVPEEPDAISGAPVDMPSIDESFIPSTEREPETIRAEFADALALFDTQYYKENNPDLSELGDSYFMHFMEHGWREHRDPSATFSTRFYLETYPDVLQLGTNPLLHYATWGRNEGRARNALEYIRTIYQLNDSDFARVRSSFDPLYYSSKNKDLILGRDELLVHYILHGWKELRDPSEQFSTEYYLSHNPDIANGSCPFVHYVLHGKREGRAGAPFSRRIKLGAFNPLVSIIVPNYNHARFLRTRIDSILAQTYRPIEIILMDDHSSDDSVNIILDYAAKYPDLIRSAINERNSGRVFAQWRKGLSLARGKLIWICESDDFCNSDFLSHCVEQFRDSSVMLTFGRVQFADEQGTEIDGLDSYREQAEGGIWGSVVTRSASEWFSSTFALVNIIPNVGGCVFRSQRLPSEVWAEALQYKISGDWFLYLVLAGGGRISYVPDAIAHFRQHGRNTSVSGFLRPHYYSEHQKVIMAIRRYWGVSDDIAARFYARLYQQFKFSKADATLGSLSSHYSNDAVMQIRRSVLHVLVCSLGFHLGGGELFPIHLANALVSMGVLVSFLCLDVESQNETMREMLDPRIPVYDAQLVEEIGVDQFIRKAGIDVIHSHNVGVEFLLFRKLKFSRTVPYIVTLHGSYEVTPIPDDLLIALLRGVTRWTYLSQKNLSHFQDLPLSMDHVSFVPNGMPDDPRPFPYTREDLGIAAGDLVFLIASRAMSSKGWRPAILGLIKAQLRTNRALHLLLCGSGPDEAALREEFEGVKGVRFFGFQECISGAYRLADVALLPTRFPGESFPLTLIQAMREGRPIVATDIGEIRQMLIQDGLAAGIALNMEANDEVFASHIADAMIAMADDNFRNERARDSAVIGRQYAIEEIAKHYLTLYRGVSKERQ